MDGRRISISFVLFSLILVVLSFSVQAGGQDVDQNTTRAPGDDLYPEPEIDIQFEYEKFESDPHPTDGGDVVLTGSLTCIVPQSVPLGVICTVTLKTQSEEAHDNDIRKYDFNRDMTERNFSLYMSVFLDVKGDTDIPVDVIATWEYAKTAQASSEPIYFDTIIYVPPYGTIDISTPFHYGDIIFKTEEWFEITLEIKNLGNVDVNVELEIVDRPENLQAYIDETRFGLNSHQTTIVYLRVRQTSGKGQSLVMEIKATSNMPVNEPDDEIVISLLSEEEVEVNAPITSIIIFGSFFLGFIVMMVIFILVIRSRRRAYETTEEKYTAQDQYGPPGP